MSSRAPRLCAASFASAFPFHISFSSELVVTAVGPVLSRICPSLRPGSRASECLRVKRPLVRLDLSAIREHLRVVFVLEVLVESVVLRGQMIIQQTEDDEVELLFLGAPRISSAGALSSMGVSVSDFAIHDAAADLLFLLQVRETTLSDAQRLAAELDRQKAELHRANLRLAAQFAVTRILTESVDIEGAMPGVIAAVGEALGFEVGGFWEVDVEANVLRCMHVWNPLRPRFEALEAAVRVAVVGPGPGLVTQSWVRVEPLFGSEVEPGPFGVRAKQEGLNSSLAFPAIGVLGAPRVLGVMGFWSRASVAEDVDLKAFVQEMGVKVGQFIERRRAELALQESEERYALAARGAKDGLWDWKLRSNEVYFSPRFWAMLGEDEGAPGGSRSIDAWLTRVHPEDRARLSDALRAHIDGRTEHVEIEHRMRHKNGEHLWMLCRGIAVRDASGEAHRMAGTQTDVTDRKRAELMLIRAREDLASQLAVVERQAAAIQRLSTPILRVWEGVLAVPVIGSLDRERTDQMTERLLDELWRARAKVAVIDFTGADGVDFETASHLLRVMRAVRLLGSECVVAGVSPAMAQALVDEPEPLSDFRFFADVKSALSHVFSRLGRSFAGKG